MGLVLIERACERFRKQLSEEDNREIQQTTKVDDVRHAVRQIEQCLAARQSLRSLERLRPFLDAVDRLSKPIDVLCNGTPFLPWVWAPLKLILQLSQDHTHVMDKILAAYGSIGAALPRMSRYGEAFPDNYEFQQLLGHLYEDIIDFHSRAYRLMQKPGWKMFFTSGWGRFEYHFDALLQSISQTSELIDKEASSFDIIQAREWRQKSLEEAMSREKRWESEQREMVLSWLEVGDSVSNQEVKLEWLRSHCCEGTSQWLTKSTKARSWLQFGRGHPVLWLHGKPGSGKSILCSQLVYFLRSDRTRKCLFFFCDFHTTSYGVTAQILRSLCAQIIRLAPELVSFLYDECVVAGRTPSISFLKLILPKLLTAFKDIRIIIDGIDEVSPSQHRELMKTLVSIAESQENCKLLFSSQDIPSIKGNLKGKPTLFIGAESSAVAKDINTIVESSLEEINDKHGGSIPADTLTEVHGSILERAQGMFLWVHLILKILETASSINDLRTVVKSLPKDLADAYNKILTNISQRSSADDLSKQRRIFGWMLFSKGHRPLRQYELRLAMTLHSESCQVDENTKSFPNALDICKPFIEDGPGGCAVFIHSTVPQFLLSQSSGPFIKEIDSHHDISLACLAQLLQSFYFVEEDFKSTQVRYRIGQGFHGLLPYAAEYWVEHLLEYLDKCQEHYGSIETSPVMQKLLELCDEHNRLLEAREGGRSISAIEGETPDIRLSYLEGFPVAFSLLSCILRFRKVVNANKETQQCTPDPTLFSSVREAYHNGVVHLLGQNSCSGLSQEDLVAFKDEFGPSAFVCHIHRCNRSVVGYASASLLRDHEARHQGTLKCPVSSCLYGLDFTSSKQLKAHMRKRHPAPGATETPSRIRREIPTAATMDQLQPGIVQAQIGQPPAMPPHGFTVTPQELAQVRSQKPQFAEMPDDKLRQMLLNIKGQTWQNNMRQQQQARKQGQQKQGTLAPANAFEDEAARQRHSQNAERAIKNAEQAKRVSPKDIKDPTRNIEYGGRKASTPFNHPLRKASKDPDRFKISRHKRYPMTSREHSAQSRSYLLRKSEAQPGSSASSAAIRY